MKNIIPFIFGITGGVFSVVYYLLMVFMPKMADSFLFGKLLPTVVPFLISVIFLKVFNIWFHVPYTWIQFLFLLCGYVLGVIVLIFYFRMT